MKTAPHWHIRRFVAGSMIDDIRQTQAPTARERYDPDSDVRVFRVEGYDDMVCFPPCARRMQTAMLEGRSC